MTSTLRYTIHLYMRRRIADDCRRANTSGLAEWRLRSPLMLGYIPEVMIHFEVFLRTNIRDADYGTPSGMRRLAAGLAMAPNIEILHFVLFCNQHTAGTMPIPYLSSTAILTELSNDLDIRSSK